MTLNSKLSKVLDFRQNYLCDFHLWGERGLVSMPTEIGQLTVPRYKHFHIQSGRHRVINNLGANLTFRFTNVYILVVAGWVAEGPGDPGHEQPQLLRQLTGPGLHPHHTQVRHNFTLHPERIQPPLQELETKAKAGCQRKKNNSSLSGSVSVLEWRGMMMVCERE